jgi:excisionase family DNA binding protein
MTRASCLQSNARPAPAGLGTAGSSCAPVAGEADRKPAARTQPPRPDNFPPLRCPKQAARFLGCSVSWLAKQRVLGTGPAFVKLGRAVRYTEEALIAYVRAHQRLSTSE